jgi:hypothetical protein
MINILWPNYMLSGSWYHINLTCFSIFTVKTINKIQSENFRHLKFYIPYFEVPSVFILTKDSWMFKCWNITFAGFVYTHSDNSMTFNSWTCFAFRIFVNIMWNFSKRMNKIFFDIRNNKFMVSAFYHKVQTTMFMSCKWKNQQIVYSFIQNAKQNFIYSV